jgi:signal transduction histidine kinase
MAGLNMHTQTSYSSTGSWRSVVPKRQPDVADAATAADRPQLRSRPGKDAALLNALTIIAHDLRGPLANLAVLIELIETYAEMRAHDRLQSTTRKANELIERLEGLLNGFLERARETGDPLSFEPALLDGADVMRDAAELNRPIAESRGITIDDSRLAPSVLEGDRRLLLQATDNLVANAVKYAPAGSTVHCSAARRGRETVLSVTDEGQGLSEADLSQAFRPFATLTKRYESRQPSWGLGLWIVRLITERHGGRVEVTTGEGEHGTRFSLHLPA